MEGLKTLQDTGKQTAFVWLLFGIKGVSLPGGW